MHNSNGTYCAVLDQCVYITCASAKDKITDEGCGIFKVVNKYTNDRDEPIADTCYRAKCVHWVMLTKESWDAFTGEQSLPPIHCPECTSPTSI